MSLITTWLGQTSLTSRVGRFSPSSDASANHKAQRMQRNMLCLVVHFHINQPYTHTLGDVGVNLSVSIQNNKHVSFNLSAYKYLKQSSLFIPKNNLKTTFIIRNEIESPNGISMRKWKFLPLQLHQRKSQSQTLMKK